jgi:small subunit ribosomal protein S6
MYILSPEISEEETKQFVEKFANVITEQGGVITKMDLWGKRRLAYEVKKLKEGYYVLLLFQGEPAVAQELERIFKINESVIRYLVIRVDEAGTDANASVNAEAEVEVNVDTNVEAEVTIEADVNADAVVEEVEIEVEVETDTEDVDTAVEK